LATVDANFNSHSRKIGKKSLTQIETRLIDDVCECDG
jgi:hypothetical protein